MPKPLVTPLKKRYAVAHVRLDRGGYSRRGQYFGHVSGTKIYSVWDEETGDHFFVRAENANAARIRVHKGVY